MLAVDVVTIFPAMVRAAVSDGILQRAVDKSLARIGVHDLRDHTDDRHRSVDDASFGGGPGMVMKAEPFLRAVERLLPDGRGPRDAIVLLSPRGRVFRQSVAEEFAALERLVLLCGRYEGVDERVRLALDADEVSVGDFVLTGGEAAALCVIEATLRLLPGALGDSESALEDSFARGLLDFPHFTRPALLRGLAVPEVLLSGDHGRVRRWRRKAALAATRQRRPDLLAQAELGPEDQALLREIEAERAAAAGAPADAPLTTVSLAMQTPRDTAAPRAAAFGGAAGPQRR
jgi:tRNA (guanine37-N1)-methyltransferase